MIDSDSFLEMLHNHYQGHTFRITQHDRGRTLYVDDILVKVHWLDPTDAILEDLSLPDITMLDQMVIDSVMAEVNNTIAQKLEEEASKQIPDLRHCLCGEQPKLQIDFSKEENLPMVAVKCLCGLRGKAFEVRDAIKAAEWWNDLHSAVKAQE